MRTFVFSKYGEKYFKKLSIDDQNSMGEKLRFFKESDTFAHNIRAVKNLLPATHRIRIGSIRMLVRYKDENTIEILKVGYRGDIYK